MGTMANCVCLREPTDRANADGISFSFFLCAWACHANVASQAQPKRCQGKAEAQTGKGETHVTQANIRGMASVANGCHV